MRESGINRSTRAPIQRNGWVKSQCRVYSLAIDTANRTNGNTEEDEYKCIDGNCRVESRHWTGGFWRLAKSLPMVGLDGKIYR